MNNVLTKRSSSFKIIPLFVFLTAMCGSTVQGALITNTGHGSTTTVRGEVVILPKNQDGKINREQSTTQLSFVETIVAILSGGGCGWGHFSPIPKHLSR